MSASSPLSISVSCGLAEENNSSEEIRFEIFVNV
jgi:hypothetical protein